MKCLFQLNQSSILCLSLGAIALLLPATICLGAGPTKTELAAMSARKSPDWFTQGVIYQIWPRAFTPEGTISAATKRLPAIAELGANVVYLCPIMLADDDMRPEYWSPRQKASGTNNPRNPYRMKDYFRVDPEYGTDEDLRQFVATAHKLKLRVLLDLVYFHCGPTSNLMDRPGFVQRDATGKAVTGGWAFPRLNFENPALREYLWSNMEYWVKEFHVDGYRCDVADLVPLDFWEEARVRLDQIRPDLVMLSEGVRPADQISAFDISYGFNWYWTTRDVLTKSEPASKLRTIWEQQQAEWPRGARFTRHTDNHDMANEMKRPDVLFGEQAAHAMSVINFTIDGVPFLYNGQEIGDTNRHSIFARWPIGWQATCLPRSQATLKFYKQLCQLRRNEPALQSGEVVWVDHDQSDAVVAFCRHVGKEEILSVVNLSNRAIKVRLDLPAGASSYKPLLSRGVKVGPAEEKAALDLQGFGFLVGKK